MHRHPLEDAVLDHHAALPAAWLHSVHGRLPALSAPAGTFSAWLSPVMQRLCTISLWHFLITLPAPSEHITPWQSTMLAWGRPTSTSCKMGTEADATLQPQGCQGCPAVGVCWPPDLPCRMIF